MIAITGASGYLGANLICNLPDAVAVPRTARQEAQHFETWLECYKPETIIHCAGLADVRKSIADPALTYRVNTIDTVTLLNVLEGKNIKLIFIGTDKVFGAQERCNFGTPYRPYNSYDASKIAAEIVFNDWCLRNPGILARFPNFYGWSDPHEERLIPSVLKAIAEKKTEFTARTMAGQRRQYIFMPDAVGIVKRLIELPATSSKHHFAPAIIKTVREVVDDVCEAFGVFMNLTEQKLPGEAPQLSLAHSTPLEVQFTTWEQSLKIIVDNLRPKS